MAQRTIVQKLDDIDGSEAEETLSFALDGRSYEIDLSVQNAQKLRDALAPFIDAARRTSGRGRRAGSSSGRQGFTHWTAVPTQARSNQSDVRAWARENGYQVNDRGRLPREVLDAYHAAH